MVVERHPEEGAEVVILVDATQDIGHELDSSLRWTVQAALAMNDRHQGAMDRVGLIDWGGTIHWIEPKVGRRARHAIVQALLNIEVIRRNNRGGGDETELPVGRLPSRCVVLAISSNLSAPMVRDLARIRRRGHQVTVVRPLLAEHLGPEIPARVGRILLKSRQHTLTEAGVMVISWPTTEPLGQVLISIDLQSRRRRGPGGRR